VTAKEEHFYAAKWVFLQKTSVFNEKNKHKYCVSENHFHSPYKHVYCPYLAQIAVKTVKNET
jgi:hypothetical protein